MDQPSLGYGMSESGPEAAAERHPAGPSLRPDKHGLERKASRFGAPAVRVDLLVPVPGVAARAAPARSAGDHAGAGRYGGRGLPFAGREIDSGEVAVVVREHPFVHDPAPQRRDHRENHHGRVPGG